MLNKERNQKGLPAITESDLGSIKNIKYLVDGKN